MRVRFVVFSVLVAVMTAGSAVAQQRTAEGHWAGAIQLPGTALAFDVDLARGPEGWKGDISIPAQNAKDLPLVAIRVQGDSVAFAIQGIPGNPTFAGVLTQAGPTIAGSFTQGGQTFTFSMTGAAAPADAARQALTGFDAWVDSAMAAWKVVGAGVGIIVDGQVVYARGHGMRDRDARLPVTTSTLFAIGSSSKAFTVFALGNLVDQGRLDWDTPVITYMPDFRMYDPVVTQRLTPRDLVTHRSGLPRHDLAWYNDTVVTRDELVRRIRYLPPNKDLRETFQYNNLMFLTAGYLVGRISGTSWENGVRQLVLDPLSMTSTNFSIRESERAADHATGYGVRRDTIEAMAFRDISTIGPAGSINSTVDDMLKWVGMHLAGGKVGDRQIVSTATLHDMYAPHMPIGGMPTEPEFGAQNYGMGWFVTTYRGHYIVYHGGNIDGFSTLVTLFPQDNVGLVVMVNQNASALPTLATRHAVDRIFKAPFHDWSGEALARRDRAQAAGEQAEQRKETTRVPGTNPSRVLEEFAGDYLHPGYGTITVSVDGKQLVATFHGIRTPLEHWHYDVFNGGRNPDDPTFADMKYNFVANARGDIEGVEVPFEPMLPPELFKRQPDARLVDPTFLTALAGRYALVNDTVRIELQGNVLVAKVGNQEPRKLLPYRHTEFDLEGLTGYSVVFVLDASGRVTQASFRQPNGVFEAKRVE
jgi:CubicO group peptidase (beta-lactamase class C family)